jgi:hypothetical protein
VQKKLGKKIGTFKAGGGGKKSTPWPEYIPLANNGCFNKKLTF